MAGIFLLSMCPVIKLVLLKTHVVGQGNMPLGADATKSSDNPALKNAGF